MKTATELRKNVNGMTKEDFINYRNELENNWNENLRPLMNILSLACINKFNTTLVRLG